MVSRLFEAWEATVRAAPEQTALIDASTREIWTRGRVHESALAWAARYGSGLARMPVVFALPNGAEWLTVCLGLFASGAVAVPLDPSEPLASQQALARAARARFIWHAGTLRPVGAAAKRGPRVRLLKVTSGSTGTPRVLPFTDEQLLADGRQICATMGIAAVDRNLGCIPLGHSYGLGNLLVPLMLQGTEIVAGAAPLPQVLAAAIAEWSVSVFPAVPALLRALAVSDVAPEQLRSLRTVISAGAPLAPDIAAAFRRRFGVAVHNFYGSSETGGIAYDRTGTSAEEGRAAGTPMEGVALEFTRGGRFWVSSAAVKSPGRFRPADIGELNAHGELVLRGRSGRMVKLAGRRLDPAEIERALKELPGVRDAWVGLNPERAETLVAAVAAAQSAAEIGAALRERIAGWKVPRKIVALAEFPLTDRGKTDHKKLREIMADGGVA